MVKAATAEKEWFPRLRKTPKYDGVGHVTLDVLRDRDVALQEKFADIGNQLALIIRLIDEKKCDECKIKYADLEYFSTLNDSYNKQIKQLRDRIIQLTAPAPEEESKKDK